MQSDEPWEETTVAVTPISDCCPSPEDSDVLSQQQISTVCATSASQDDIGSVNADELKRASDSVKLKALQSRFKPPRGWIAPSKGICGKQCKILEDFSDESVFPTLHYSKSVDGVFCVACMIFSSGDTILRTKALIVSKIVSRHLATPAHRSAQLRAAEFLNVALGKSQSIYSKLDRSHQQAIECNKYGLKTVIDLIAICGHQNILIRGHTDERSNFQELLKYHAEGDELPKQYVENAPANAKNELIEICGKQIQDKILHKCRDARWFSLLADETADISNVEQVTLVVRYVDCSGSYSV